ncbi:MAG: tyrosine-type recombinase/integrase [Cellvibrio sp.]|uniref:tyrosine-type recombinase/integrase n=1 Tax=Cellvibrio sp. TaxID=1965322 RepID=UPI0031A127C2
MPTYQHDKSLQQAPWNKGKLIGQKAPLKVSEVWEIRVRLQITHQIRELAMFNLAIDSKLRACDLVKLKVRDICHGSQILHRATIMQQKTHRPVQFEITSLTRQAIGSWLTKASLRNDNYLFPSRVHGSPHITTRQYARIVHRWISDIDLDASMYGTDSLRRTKASLIYKRTKNLRAVQILLGHTKLESTVRYLGTDVDDALELAEQTEI